MGNSSTRKRAAAQRHVAIRAKSPDLRRETGDFRFVADVMLGRLAKWLRIAGFDVLYSNSYSDDELVELSSREGRILLSRDTRLLVRKAVRDFIFLESGKVEEQIRQILRMTQSVRLPGILSRCLECNAFLENIPRSAVRHRVPPYVYQSHGSFKYCPACRRIYWAGTHRQAVLQTLGKLLPLTEHGDSAEDTYGAVVKD